MEGSPQDNWGMFSYPFYLRMQQNTPEFEELAAFQAGGWQLSTRRGETDRVAKPLRGGVCQRQLFFYLRRGRLLRADHRSCR